MNFLDIFKKIGKLVASAFGAAKDSGLTDEVVELALKLARQAASMFVNNYEKREWVVDMLKAQGVPESIARIAVELAVQLIKKAAAAEQQ